MPFIPHTDTDIQKMLNVIGVDSIEDLFDEIPSVLRIAGLDNVPEAVSEQEITRIMGAFAAQDGRPLCFLGAGAYEHHIPAAVWEITTRGEFYSAYTPYQAEGSQGTLQVIYEFQSMICGLTGMQVSNASMYDGASSMAEAALMAVRANRKSKTRRILVAGTVNPVYLSVARAITNGQGLVFEELACCAETGSTLVGALEGFSGEDITAVVLQSPNFFGVLENIDAITDWAHQNGALVISVTNPTSLALLKPPGEWGEHGADIVCGEGQPLGIPMSSGGPYFGFLACKMPYVRQIPGRIVGRTIDLDGKPGFSLTLQAREQHIRRSKATSNICTNQGLAVTAATIYMALLGPEGLERVASACVARTRELVATLCDIDGITPAFSGNCFHETVLSLDRPAGPVLAALAERNIIGGLELSDTHPELGNALLVCATETKTAEDIATYRDAMSDIFSQAQVA